MQTRRTREFNPPSSLIPAFSKPFDDLNGSIAQSLLVGRWTFKAELGTGFRAANLAELAANGLHEGAPNWYLGDPTLRIEQCLNLELSAARQWQNFGLQGSVFSNRFFSYTYLMPTGTEYFGFPLYRYVQDNARFQGFEAGFHWERKTRYSLSADYSYLSARRDDGSYLPFIPANRLMCNGKYFLPKIFDGIRQVYPAAGLQFVGAQSHPARYESFTPAYGLLQAGLGVQLQSMHFRLIGRNLTDRQYADHLSRLRYLGAYDMGRSIILNFSWDF